MTNPVWDSQFLVVFSSFSCIFFSSSSSFLSTSSLFSFDASSLYLSSILCSRIWAQYSGIFFGWAKITWNWLLLWCSKNYLVTSFERSFKISFNPVGTDIVLDFGLLGPEEGGTEFWRRDSRCSLFLSLLGGWWVDPPPFRTDRFDCFSSIGFGLSMLFGRLKFWRDLSL